MEAFIQIFQAPIVIMAGIIALLCITVQFIADAKRLSFRNALYRKTMAKAKVQNAKPISVIIELRRAADSIMPLLDHLQSHQYTKLQVVIIVKQTAGSRAMMKLTTYRRKHPGSRLTIVKHRKGLTTQTVVRRYATGSLVMRLDADDRLSPDFFSLVSLQFIGVTTKAVIPRTQVILDRTLGSAMQAILAIWADLRHTYTKPPLKEETIQPGVVYLKTALTGRTASSRKIEYSHLVYRLVPASPHRQFVRTFRNVAPNSKLAWLGALSVIAATILIAITLRGDAGQLIAFVMALYCVSLLFLIFTTRGYSLYARFNLILLSPISVVYFLFIGTYGILRNVILSRPKRRFTISPALLLNRFF